ncbi:MAG: hypothetical protein HYY58_02325 [Candidatus Omnitrophica bacterium]|nr:hypothetical protein [Candidatus Omnitrophota bacterium]
MQTGSWIQTLIVQPVQSLVNQLMAFLPTLLGALLILLIGWLIAEAVQSLIVRILKTIGLDKLADQTQLSAVFAKGGIKQKLSELIGGIVYWLLMLAVVMIVFNALQLTVAAQLLQSVVTFLPNVIAAVFLLIVGIFAAAFLAATVRTAASNAGIAQATAIGQLVQIVVVIFAAVAALQQLKIPFFGEVFLIILGGLSLGCAIAFGLGCKELAGRWVSGLIEQFQTRKR